MSTTTLSQLTRLLSSWSSTGTSRNHPGIATVALCTNSPTSRSSVAAPTTSPIAGLPRSATSGRVSTPCGRRDLVGHGAEPVLAPRHHHHVQPAPCRLVRQGRADAHRRAATSAHGPYFSRNSMPEFYPTRKFLRSRADVAVPSRPRWSTARCPPRVDTGRGRPPPCPRWRRSGVVLGERDDGAESTDPDGREEARDAVRPDRPRRDRHRRHARHRPRDRRGLRRGRRQGRRREPQGRRLRRDRGAT